MTFDIHQNVFTSDGELKETATEYREELERLFEESPEGQALRKEGIEPGWSRMMIGFGMDYLGVTPPQISPDALQEILFDLFPRKVSAPAEDAPEIIRELRAFWQFMQREFGLKNAAACLEVLDDDAITEMQEEMSNPENFGFAKSLVMQGLERGFDLSTEEGLNTWMATYNAEIAAGIGTPPPLNFFSPPRKKARSTGKNPEKTRRKLVRDTRKRNRRRK
jgi:hypothetical protein